MKFAVLVNRKNPFWKQFIKYINTLQGENYFNGDALPRYYYIWDGKKATCSTRIHERIPILTVEQVLGINIQPEIY